MSDKYEPTQFELDLMKTIQDNIGIASFCINDVKIINKDLTGVGFYLDFEKSHGIAVRSDYRDDKWLDLHGVFPMFGEVGFIIYINDGEVDCIEGYIYDGNWPTEPSDYKFVVRPNSSPA